MIKHFVVSAAALALAAWAQEGIEDWAIPAGVTGQGLIALNQPVLNRPFSGTAILRLSHTLEDGIHISQTSTTLMYRDAQGRRRNETDSFIEISDPVARAGITLNSTNHTATKRSDGGYIVSEEKLAAASVAASIPESVGNMQKQKKGSGGRGGSRNEVVRESLGLQTVNGVLASGVRTTLTIPVGAIGNDREIKSVKETWTSAALHILVKSINSDPRFGTSTYELTNIVQAAPDATLFQMQVPPGYTVRWEQTFKANLP